MKASLQIVVDALVRAGLVIEVPPDGNGRGLPEITGLAAEARRLERGILYCALRGAVPAVPPVVPAAVARDAPAALVEVRQPVPATTAAALVERGASGVAMEVSSHSLDQGRVDGLIFRAAILTNLTRDHLDYHETFEAYFAAKAKLIGYLADAGLAVVNANDAAWDRLPHTTRRITFSALATEADVTAADVHIDAGGARFTLVAKEGRYPVSLPLLGRFNVANALGVAACALGLGVPARVVAERLSTAPQVPGRMERIAVDPCVILRDYAHTPDALERALETIREVTPTGGRVVVVFGAGGDRGRGKRAPMGEIAVRLADIAIATSDNPRTEDPEKILDDVEAGMSGRQHYRMAERRAAIAQALEVGRQGDTLLLAGKGHEIGRAHV